MSPFNSRNFFRSPLSNQELSTIADHIRAGQVGLFPTDTVYGLGALAENAAATAAIYRMKNRPLERSLPVLIGSWEMFERYSGPIKKSYLTRIRKNWPGALTVVVPAGEAALSLSYHCLREGTLAMRLPDHPSLRYLIEQVGSPLAATSANLSGGKDPLSVELVPGAIRDQVNWAWSEPISAGSAVPSSVIDLTGGKPEIIREGAVKF